MKPLSEDNGLSINEFCLLRDALYLLNIGDSSRNYLIDKLRKCIKDVKVGYPLHAVYLCGATDCFVRAVFISKEDAEKWAKDNDRENPEKPIIKSLNYIELLEALSETEP